MTLFRFFVPKIYKIYSILAKKINKENIQNYIHENVLFYVVGNN